MSAFLGPIHHWLFKKILIQGTWVEEIYRFAEKSGWEPLKDRMAEIPKGPLEEIIDTGNIHGWLQEQVNHVEKGMAEAVTAFVSRKEKRLEDIGRLLYEDGKSNALSGVKSPREVYDALNDSLLDGMPCDRVNQIISESEDELVWQMTHDIHAPYWNEAGGDVNHYFWLRERWIEGFMSLSGFRLNRQNITWSIGKE